MPFLTPAHLTIHYELAGWGETALVLVHGNFASWRWWRPVLDRLPPGYRAFAPDLRGCGDTDRPPDGYTIEQLAADLADFTRALDLPPFHLVGHSLGGAVAMQFALDHPHRVQTLTLAAPSPAEGMPFLRSANSGPSPLPGLLDLGREASLATLDVLNRLWRSLDANRPVLRQALKQWMPALKYDDAFEALVDDAARMAPEAVVGFVRALNAWNVQAELGRLNAPTLTLWGERDPLVPRAGLERTVAGLPRGRLVVWPDVGHAPQFEQPDRFARLLFDFVGESRPVVTTPRPRPNWLRALLGRLRPKAG